MAIKELQVIGYVSSEKADLSFGEEHIREKLDLMPRLDTAAIQRQ